MDRFVNRAERSLYSGYIISFVVHLGIISVLVLTLLPLGLREDPLDLQVTVDEVGAELVILDVTLAQNEFEDEPMLLDVIGVQDEASFDVPHPLAQLAVGEHGTGKNIFTAGTSAGANGGRGQASFFGTQASGDRFVYVLDVSGSMNKGNGRRLRRAVSELLRSIDQLREDQMFYVLLFASSTRQMFDDRTLVPMMLPATEENKARVHEWLAQVQASGATHPERALHVGLNLSPSAVFFLSDGKFNRPLAADFFGGEALDAKTVIERSNPGNIPVHAIAFEDPSSRQNMNEISIMTGGEFRYIRSGDRATETKVARASVRDPFDVGSAKMDSLAERKAAKWMGYADEMEAINNKQMAEFYYTKVIRDFPNTNAATEAGRRRHENRGN